MLYTDLTWITHHLCGFISHCIPTPTSGTIRSFSDRVAYATWFHASCLCLQYSLYIRFLSSSSSTPVPCFPFACADGHRSSSALISSFSCPGVQVTPYHVSSKGNINVAKCRIKRSHPRCHWTTQNWSTQGHFTFGNKISMAGMISTYFNKQTSYLSFLL